MADHLTPAQRSVLMASIKGRDTKPERILRSLLHRSKLRFRKNERDLPGSPDVVFRRARVAVFVDGDFWHGHRFPAWRSRLSAHWQARIEANIRRDRRNFAKLRRRGWKVVRVWEHQVRRNPEAAAERVRVAVAERLACQDMKHGSQR